MSQYTLKAGQAFGPYQILSVIGSGGMGQIFKVQRGPKIYALKILHDQSLEAIERFRREAEALLKTEQLPYFSRIYSFALEPLPHLLIEYFEAPDLESWREDNPLSEDQALILVQKLARSLQALHAIGLVHRDFKPKNILILENPNESGELEIEPVIIDFGLVTGQSFEALTLSNEYVGTPLTMAPEQWGSLPDSKLPAVDIWALGIIYYFLIAGEYPFKGTAIQIFQTINKFSPKQINHQAPVRSQLIFDAFLQVNPQDRATDPESVIQTAIDTDPTAILKSKRNSKVAIFLLVITTFVAVLAFSVSKSPKLRQLLGGKPVVSERAIAKKNLKVLKRQFIKPHITEFLLQKISPKVELDSAINRDKSIEHIGLLLKHYEALSAKEKRSAELIVVALQEMKLIDKSLVIDSKPAKTLRETLNFQSQEFETAIYLQSPEIRSLYNSCKLLEAGKIEIVFATIREEQYSLTLETNRQKVLNDLAFRIFVRHLKQSDQSLKINDEVMNTLYDWPEFDQRLNMLFARFQKDDLNDHLFPRFAKLLIANHFGISRAWPKLTFQRFESIIENTAKQFASLEMNYRSENQRQLLKLCATLIYLQAQCVKQHKRPTLNTPTPFILIDRLLNYLNNFEGDKGFAHTAFINGLVSNFLNPFYIDEATSVNLKNYFAENQKNWFTFPLVKQAKALRTPECYLQTNRVFYWSSPNDNRRETYQQALTNLLEIDETTLIDNLKSYYLAALVNAYNNSEKTAQQKSLARVLQKLKIKVTPGSEVNLTSQLIELTKPKDIYIQYRMLHGSFSITDPARAKICQPQFIRALEIVKQLRSQLDTIDSDSLLHRQRINLDLTRMRRTIYARRIEQFVETKNPKLWNIAIADFDNIILLDGQLPDYLCRALAKVQFQLGKDFDYRTYTQKTRNKNTAERYVQEELRKLQKQ